MSSASPDLIAPETFGRLHPRAITDRDRIASLLEGWRRAEVLLRRGTNQAIQRELATVVSVGDGEAELSCTDFGPIDRFLFLSAEFEGIPYFCSAQVRDAGEGESRSEGGRRRVRISWPAVIYRAERRDRARRPAEQQRQWVRLVRRDGRDCEARIVDVSGDGLGVVLPESESLKPGEGMEMRPGSRDLDRPGSWAVVRNQREDRSRRGWRRIGLSVLPEPPRAPLPGEPASDVLSALGGLIPAAEDFVLPEQPEVVHLRDHRGERIVGLLDRVGESRGAPAVILPSAWGKTKETLSGLAATLLASFATAGLPVSVLRFDGIRKRGESDNDVGCEDPALGNLHYTFTQGATDLLAAARFLQEERGAGPVVIVSFSVASVEARRALVLDGGERFAGWVSVVGATDPQSLIRVISGGVDYLAGAERGVRFGRQDVQGLLLDIDHTASEALGSRIAFLEDARRDFAAIRCPLTWITGTHDAWMDPRRIEDVLSFGPRAGRRLITSETGHQLKSSREAVEIFGIVASECARMLGGGESIRPVAPDPKA
ncbi:MAG: PilZ domain-containing protein, partial [bacterium]